MTVHEVIRLGKKIVTNIAARGFGADKAKKP
jgi:hypothetical protein